MNIRWLKFWIWLGAVAAIAAIVLPPILFYRASVDVIRYRECVKGIRLDCTRTMVWNLVDAAYLLEQQNGTDVGSALGLDLFGARADGTVRTSETSPFIQKVEPKGMANANGIYSANAGATVTFKATMSGVVSSVELFQAEGTDGRPTKVSTFTKGSDGLWTGTYKLSPGFVGTLEVRAYGNDPKDLAVLVLPVAAN
jgi:hypothetical protein